MTPHDLTKQSLILGKLQCEAFLGNKLPFLSIPKKATRHAAQNVQSKESCQLSTSKNLCKMSTEIGSLLLTSAPLMRLMPLIKDLTQYSILSLPHKGLSKPHSKCTILTTFKYCFF